MILRRNSFNALIKTEYSLLLLLSWQLITVHCVELQGRFKLCPGKRLSQNVISSRNSPSETHCCLFCLRQNDCFGFNLIFQVANTYKCEALSSTLLIASCDNENLATEDGVDFYIKGKLSLFGLLLLIIVSNINLKQEDCLAGWAKCIRKLIFFSNQCTRITCAWLHFWCLDGHNSTRGDCETSCQTWWIFWIWSMLRWCRIRHLYNSRNQPIWMPLWTRPVFAGKIWDVSMFLSYRLDSKAL